MGQSSASRSFRSDPGALVVSFDGTCGRKARPIGSPRAVEDAHWRGRRGQATTDLKPVGPADGEGASGARPAATGATPRRARLRATVRSRGLNRSPRAPAGRLGRPRSRSPGPWSAPRPGAPGPRRRGRGTHFTRLPAGRCGTIHRPVSASSPCPAGSAGAARTGARGPARTGSCGWRPVGLRGGLGKRTQPPSLSGAGSGKSLGRRRTRHGF